LAKLTRISKTLLWATLAVSWLKLAEDADRIRSGQLAHPTDLDQLASAGDR
jgi:hypothetical protein